MCYAFKDVIVQWALIVCLAIGKYSESSEGAPSSVGAGQREPID